jgi:hypothetical protein
MGGEWMNHEMDGLLTAINKNTLGSNNFSQFYSGTLPALLWDTAEGHDIRIKKPKK